MNEFLSALTENDVWMVIMQLSIVIVGLFSGGKFTVPVVKWIKGKLGTNGGWTMVVLAAFATALTLAISVVEQKIAPGTIRPDTWGAMLLAIIVQATIRYNQLKEDANSVRNMLK